MRKAADLTRRRATTPRAGPAVVRRTPTRLPEGTRAKDSVAVLSRRGLRNLRRQPGRKSAIARHFNLGIGSEAGRDGGQDPA